jgi:hypothetical protein
MLNLRYYKITYFELIFLLNFLFNTITSTLKNENKPSDIIEKFISKFLGDPPINSDAKRLIDGILDINEIYLVKYIQPPNIVTYVKIDDKDYEFALISKNEKANVISIKNTIEILKNLEDSIFKITQPAI